MTEQKHQQVFYPTPHGGPEDDKVGCICDPSLRFGLAGASATYDAYAAHTPEPVIEKMDHSELCMRPLFSGSPCARSTFFTVDGEPMCAEHRPGRGQS
jgi:hypothetical protein